MGALSSLKIVPSYAFNQQVSILKNSFSDKVRVSFISITAHSIGGAAVKTAVSNGTLNQVAPNKITLSECDYINVTEEVWKKYVKQSRSTSISRKS